MNELQREKLEILDGSRSREMRRRSAVRVEDLQGLLEMPPRLQSKSLAGATPTAEEYAALLKDVQMLHRRMTAIAEALRGKLLA